MYPAELEIKDTTDSITSASYLDLLLFIRRDGQLHTSIYDYRGELNFKSQTFRSLWVIFHLSRPMTFLFLSLYDTHGLAPRTDILLWGPGDFPVSYSNRDTSWNAWNRHSGSYMVDTRVLFSNMESPSHECSKKFWPLTSYSGFPTDQTVHQFHDLDTELDLHRITSGFHGALRRVWHASRKRLPFRALGSVPLHRTCLSSNCWDQFPELAMSFLDNFHLQHPLGTYWILLV